MMKSKEAFLLNIETGEEVKIIDGSDIINWCNQDADAVNICNSYHFECDVKLPLMNQAAKDLHFGSPAWKTARQLSDELNDLIEEYLPDQFISISSYF